MIRTTKLFFLLFAFMAVSLVGQETNTTPPSSYGYLTEPVYVPSLAQQMRDGTFIEASDEVRLGQPKRSGANITVPGKGLPKGDDALVQDHKSMMKHYGKEPLLVFNAHTTNVTPSDPTGAAGPNHYVGGWNMSFQIFDKEGNALTAAASLSTLFPGNNLGDPIVLYDVEADRFIITEFDNSPNGFNVAICQGPDPVNDGWYVYTTGFSTGSFPDYTKFSIWSDAYYVTANINNTNKVFAIERNEMLQGNSSQFIQFPLPGIRTSGFYSPQFFNVTNGELPPEGDAVVVYLQDDAWAGVSVDHVKLWTVNVDWTNVSASSISNPVEIVTTPFISVFDGGSFSNVSQPAGPDQDVLQATIMNQAQYRRFPNYNSALFNFVVDTDGSGAELAGIRWFELRQDNDGDPWTIYQEGTYTSPYNNKHAFSGSMAMDAQGNIGMGYTTCSSSQQIAIYYTGRFADDTLGQMTIDETLIAQSNSNNPSNRLADYVHLTLDPADDFTFWHIAEYFNNGSRTDVVGAFKIFEAILRDIGLLGINSPATGTLSANEEITITVYNYGLDTLTFIPVNYQIDGGNIVTEIMPGPVATGQSMQYTFSQTADLGVLGQTYEITSFTSMPGDENYMNDTLTKSVEHIAPLDIGVSSIKAPVSGVGLSSQEQIQVVISNYGSVTQTNFDVSFNLDDNVHTEQVSGPLVYPFTVQHTFSETVDLSELGSYNLSAYTSLSGDYDKNNDTIIAVIENTLCQPFSSCEDGHGLYLFQLDSIDNESDCSETGYNDFTDMSAVLENDSENELTVTTHHGDQYLMVWIDFDDDFVFEEDEIVVNNYIIAPGEGPGVYTETIPFDIADGVLLGEHIMRAKTNWNDSVPLAACESTMYGETEDYVANVVLHIFIDDNPLKDKDMIVRTLSNNQFEILMEGSEINEPLIINLHNIQGHNLVQNRVENVNGWYRYHLDMSYARPGAYIIRLGNHNYGKIKKIIVY
ncbi:MAG: GEVED domain-containing protein [Bacteroidales bacterium]|nr:GEVED domain-containing protein [Bacteroidales bacterium]